MQLLFSFPLIRCVLKETHFQWCFHPPHILGWWGVKKSFFCSVFCRLSMVSHTGIRCPPSHCSSATGCVSVFLHDYRFCNLSTNLILICWAGHWFPEFILVVEVVEYIPEHTRIYTYVISIKSERDFFLSVFPVFSFLPYSTILLLSLCRLHVLMYWIFWSCVSFLEVLFIKKLFSLVQIEKARARVAFILIFSIFNKLSSSSTPFFSCKICLWFLFRGWASFLTFSFFWFTKTFLWAQL